ncbi:hypothetical protein L1887_19880 [Cichorium endivia]|nr:hypothetical protein L1887_19880 [Cichorium endivia]
MECCKGIWINHLSPGLHNVALRLAYYGLVVFFYIMFSWMECNDKILNVLLIFYLAILSCFVGLSLVQGKLNIIFC